MSEFSWLRSDPSPLLGHSRPGTFKKLADAKDPIWTRVYREWLAGGQADNFYDGRDAAAAFEKVLTGTKPGKDKPKERKDWEDFFAAAEDDYPKFYEELGKLKVDLRARSDGGKNAEALHAVGKEMAADALKKEITSQAGGDKIKIAVSARAEIEKYKNEMYVYVNCTINAFEAAEWGTGKKDYKSTAISVLMEADAAYLGAEAELRNASVEFDKDAKSPVAADRLFMALVEYSQAVSGQGQAINRVCELVVEWSTHETAAKLKKDFASYYPMLDGGFLAARTFLRIAGIAMNAQPEFKPVVSVLQLAERGVEAAVKFLVVRLESADLKNNLENAGREMKFPPGFEKTPVGRYYTKREEIGQKIDEIIKAIGLDRIKEGYDEVKDKYEILNTIDNAIAMITEVDLVPDLPDLIEMVPALGDILSAIEGIGEILNFYIAQQKVLTDVLSPEKRAELCTVIESSWSKDSGNQLLMLSVGAGDIEVTGLDAAGNILVVVAGHSGKFSQGNLRFTPFDPTARTKAVISQLTESHGDGPIEFDNGKATRQFVITWATLTQIGSAPPKYSYTAAGKSTNGMAAAIELEYDVAGGTVTILKADIAKPALTKQDRVAFDTLGSKVGGGLSMGDKEVAAVRTFSLFAPKS